MKIKFKLKIIGDKVLYIKILEQSELGFDKKVPIGKDTIRIMSDICLEFTKNTIFVLGSSDYENNNRFTLMKFKTKKGVLKFISFLRNLGKVSNKKYLNRDSNNLNIHKDFDIINCLNWDRSYKNYDYLIPKSLKKIDINKLQ